jgi:hypothetical protein
MTLAHPLALLWGLLAVPIVALYLLRARVRRELVGTGMFWDQVFSEQQEEESRWQRWRLPVSLAVQLVVLAMCVVALAEPQIPRPRRTVLGIDNSAGMNATDVQPSRLAAAKEKASEMIAALRDCDEMAILTAGGTPAVCCTPSRNPVVLHEALEAIAASREPCCMAATLQLAGEMTESGIPTRIVVLSDLCFEGASAKTSAEFVRVGTAAANRAISRLAARRVPAEPGTCEVLVEVRNLSDQSAECKLTLTLDGKPVQVQPRAISLPPNGRFQEVFRTAAPPGGRFAARLEPSDALVADNEAMVLAPPALAAVPAETDPEIRAAAPPPPISWSEGRVDGLLATDLRVPRSMGSDIGAWTVAMPWPPIWVWLVGGAFVILVVEWCLYQRRVTV